MILSKSDQMLKKSILDRDSYYINNEDNIPYEIEFSLARLFETELKLIKNINYCLNSLSSRSDFNIIDVFTLFDENNFNYINQKK